MTITRMAFSPMRDSNLGQPRMAVFEDCQVTMLITQPPLLDAVANSSYKYDENMTKIWQCKLGGQVLGTGLRQRDKRDKENNQSKIL